MTNQLHQFELYVLRKFSDRNWYYTTIMDKLIKDGFYSQNIDYAIYSLRLKGHLLTYFDQIGQFFQLSNLGRETLLTENNPFLSPSKVLVPTPTTTELQNLKLIKEQDNISAELAKTNTKYQKLAFWVGVLTLSEY
ncbi:hypothetical protein LV89_04601 [Arcicella aurantiaca]|uniref:Uncharacterized protein n=1 Tax=Arcicella aurantiaca TaxID=591202 RepID=A0A316DJV7_9BACT|nr:hypothetical protein [Arcicella aurantiaca]PWK16943.1 hypothetical protein LV89_04601 [Arcicella aurantiaca]